MSQESYTEDFQQVADAESEWVKQRRQAAGVDDNADRVGLAFSGGGIRSATFNLGVLEALERAGLVRYIDFLSSVSGGGYIASCFAWVNSQRGQYDAKQSAFARSLAELPDKTVLHWLRAHGKFLVAEKGFSSWTLGASILASTLLNLLVLLPPILGLIAMASTRLDWLPWPEMLQLPGVTVEGHSGFAMLLALGSVCLAGFLIAVLLFAIVSGVRQVRSVEVIMSVRRVMALLLSSGLVLVAIGFIPLATSIDEMLLARMQSAFASALSQHLSYLTPIATGLLALGMGRSKHKVTLAYLGLLLLLYGLLMFGYHLVAHSHMTQSELFLWTLGASFVLACLCDINWISMHGYYRVRLTDTYLPKVDAGNDPRHEMPLAFRLSDVDAGSGTPFPIINANLNTISSTDQTLRSRGGANFTMTPLYCGSMATGFRKTMDYLGGKLALSTAFTISGAAVDPNTYATRFRPIAVLMALLNFRLGYWSINPRASDHRRLPGPWWYFFIFREMLGVGLDAKARHVHLSDGGHFENLGLYELLRRRCRYIIVSDAGADPHTSLAELGSAVERARVDFGANIDITPDLPKDGKEQAMAKGPFLMGNVTYNDGSAGQILYIKPMMQDHLTVDVYSYWREHPTFPDQSTADQFFDERQFCAYRELALQLLATLTKSDETIDVPTLFDRAREQ